MKRGKKTAERLCQEVIVRSALNQLVKPAYNGPRYLKALQRLIAIRDGKDTNQ